MKVIVRLLILITLSVTAFAADVRFNGVKPDIIIDVRSPAEFSNGHIDGAINIPVDRIGQEARSIKGLKKDSTILVYCRSGRRSAASAQILQQQGYKHVIDGGGIDLLAKSLKRCTPETC